MSSVQPRDFLRQLFDTAIKSADPYRAVLAHLPQRPKGRCVVVGAGKASAVMASAIDATWPEVDVSGVVVTRYGHAVPAGRISVLEAAHPFPDAMSVEAAERILASVADLTENDLVIALMSGGGSALMTLPAKGISLEDKQAVNLALLKSGATIAEMNVVRQHLSAIKGGRLVRAARPAKVVTLVVSDVPGDDPAIVASGPTLAATGTIAEARGIVRRHGMQLPNSAIKVLNGDDTTVRRGEVDEDVTIVTAPVLALRAAADIATSLGVTPIILSDCLEGESQALGITMAGIARSIRRHASPLASPAVVLSGGETTVTIGRGPAGRGGRNTEFLLSLAIALNAEQGVWALAGDSDGIDGTEDAAGAIIAPDSLKRAQALQMGPRKFLASHDSYTFFHRLGDLLVTGPTGTNVNDIRAVLVL